MKRIVFDLESDGFLETATKIHCLCWYDIDTKESGSTTNYNEMKRIVYQHSFSKDNQTILIGHKIITYDIPMLEKFLNIDLSEGVRQIDTLGLSQYLYPKRLKHGLESWGKDFGIEKPEIDVWIDDGTPEFIPRMLHRCSEDVKINTKLFELEIEYLKRIYSDRGDINRIMGYISFKLQCAREQEEQKLKIDVEKCKTNLVFLQGELEGKKEVLRKIMPKHTTYKIASKPKVMYKKDGSVSAHGVKWFERLRERGLPDHHNGALKLVDKIEEGNPGSHDQLKEWLFTLGWIPTTFKFVREKIGGVTDYSQPARKIPQLASDDNTGLCESVKLLFEKEPQLEELESFFVIRHRIGILEGFLENIDENHFLKAEVSGFTNTLRFTHKMPIVNLPQIPKLYWKEIRECIIAPDNNHILCGADMSGLEDQTKRHYMYYYDPDYVNEMIRLGEDFDPHLYIAVKAGLLTQEESDWFKWADKQKDLTVEEVFKYARIKGIRLKAKKTNFAAIYLAGPAKIAVTANIPLKEATIFYTAYWKVNWSVKEVTKNIIIKTVDTQKWLWNPVAHLWYILKTEKDAFSTLNQGTGAYCFDTWIRYCRAESYRLCMQYHDEHVSARLKGDEERTRKILLSAIDKTNEELKLNITLGISIKFGDSYASIH